MAAPKNAGKEAPRAPGASILAASTPNSPESAHAKPTNLCKLLAAGQECSKLHTRTGGRECQISGQQCELHAGGRCDNVAARSKVNSCVVLVSSEEDLTACVFPLNALSTRPFVAEPCYPGTAGRQKHSKPQSFRTTGCPFQSSLCLACKGPSCGTRTCHTFAYSCEHVNADAGMDPEHVLPSVFRDCALSAATLPSQHFLTRHTCCPLSVHSSCKPHKLLQGRQLTCDVRQTGHVGKCI